MPNETYNQDAVHAAFKDRIRQEAERAKAMVSESGLGKVGQRVQAYYESKTNGV